MTRIGTLASTTLTLRDLKHLLHSFCVKHVGKYEALILCTTRSPKFTVPFDVKIDWSGIYLLHELFCADEPPTHSHPGYLKHEEEHPSPSFVFPSSHSASYLIPSPQISTHASTFWFPISNVCTS